MYSFKDWNSQTGLERVKLDINNFKSLRAYFKELQGWLGLGLKKINEQLGHRRAEHAFYHSSTQWDLPMAETYQELIDVFHIDRWEGFREYESLRQEYESLRRPFNNYYRLFDVMQFDQEAHITGKHDHDTIKPMKLTNSLIETTTRKGDLVVVPFAGSGTECIAAKNAGRDFIGFEINEKYIKIARERIKRETAQLALW